MDKRVAKPTLYNQSVRKTAIAMLASGRGLTEVSKELGVPRATLNDWRSEIGESTVKAEGVEIDNSGDAQVVTCRSRTIRTLSAAIKAAEVDTDVWEVERYVANKWDMGAKLGSRPDEYIAVTELWQVKVWLRKKVPSREELIADALLERMKRHAPKYPKVRRLTRISDPHMLEVSVYDTHFGKYAWGEETGSDYDLGIAERVYKAAVEELLAKATGFPVERILFPVGQDFLHIDNVRGTTVNDTRLDMDTRYQKIFETAFMATVHAVDHLLHVAPVKVLWSPGNHDYTTSWHLADKLAVWYRNCPRVEVDCSPAHRKYERYGVSLIGFTHGDEEKHNNLPTLMADEAQHLLSGVTCKEWHLGHFHNKRETMYRGADSFGSTVVRILPSLSGTDYWHYRKGYVKNRRAAEAYLWSKQSGYTGHLSANAN